MNIILDNYRFTQAQEQGIVNIALDSLDWLGKVLQDGEIVLLIYLDNNATAASVKKLFQWAARMKY